MTSCYVGLRTGFLLFVLLCICTLFFLSVPSIQYFLVNDFFATVQGKWITFGILLNNEWF